MQHRLGLWLRIEINSLSFIPIIIEERKENRLKYFLIQYKQNKLHKDFYQKIY